MHEVTLTQVRVSPKVPVASPADATPRIATTTLRYQTGLPRRTGIRRARVPTAAKSAGPAAFGSTVRWASTMSARTRRPSARCRSTGVVRRRLPTVGYPVKVILSEPSRPSLRTGDPSVPRSANVVRLADKSGQEYPIYINSDWVLTDTAFIAWTQVDGLAR